MSLSRIGKDGVSHFQLLHNALRHEAKLLYCAFDLMFEKAADLRKQPLRERKMRLKAILPRDKLIASALTAKGTAPNSSPRPSGKVSKASWPSAPTDDLTTIKGADGVAQGEIIEITGRILNRHGEPVGGVGVTIWQANCFGRYAHANDSNPAPLDPNFVGCVGIRYGDDGIYRIKTIKPGAYPAGPDWMRPPHIHFEVHGHFERLVTQMYFPGEPLNAHDRLLNSAPRPELLVATYPSPQGPPGLRVLNFDIVLSRG